ncbi:hypothetical protein V6N12_035930 [Hibiscus sabdariffa]|uniref:Uncharacterized protein n=1 Tax=Hibiscus sabdariffa TaxID=183260 RepID=A0ABR2EP61_9ROSI
MRPSVRFIVQCLNQMPSGMIKADDREKEPSTSWEARHQVSGLMRITKLASRSWLLAQQGGALLHRRRTRGSARSGASGFQCTASKIRTSLSADHCRPILDIGTIGPSTSKGKMEVRSYAPAKKSLSPFHNNKVSFIDPTYTRGFDALFIGWVAGYGILVIEAISTQCHTTINSIVGLKHESARPFLKVGHLFHSPVRDNDDRVYIYIFDDGEKHHREFYNNTRRNKKKEGELSYRDAVEKSSGVGDSDKKKGGLLNGHKRNIEYGANKGDLDQAEHVNEVAGRGVSPIFGKKAQVSWADRIDHLVNAGHGLSSGDEGVARDLGENEFDFYTEIEGKKRKKRGKNLESLAL